MPIPGTTKPHRAIENFSAKDVALTDEDMNTLEALGSQVKGMRGGEGYMASTYHNQMKK